MAKSLKIRLFWNSFFLWLFATKVSLHFWNLRKKTDFLYPIWEKKIPFHFADFRSVGDIKENFSVYRLLTFSILIYNNS
jgi:hypothetical protein